MNDYTKTDFHHYYDIESNVRRYYLKVQGIYIEVEKDVYYTCYNSYRKQLRDNRKEQEYGVISYDCQMPDGHRILDTYGKDYDYLNDIYRKDMMKAVINLIEALNDEEKELISALLFDEIKEIDLAKKYQVTQQTINKRKGKIIKNMQKKISDGYKKVKALLLL